MVLFLFLFYFLSLIKSRKKNGSRSIESIIHIRNSSTIRNINEKLARILKHKKIADFILDKQIVT